MQLDICPFFSGTSLQIVQYCDSCSRVLWDLLADKGWLAHYVQPDVVPMNFDKLAKDAGVEFCEVCRAPLNICTGGSRHK